MFVFAKPAAPTPEQSFTIFKEAAESVKDIEELVAMRFADFEVAAREGKRAPAVVRLKTKPWAGKRLRGRLEVRIMNDLLKDSCLQFILDSGEQPRQPVAKSG